MAIDFSKISDPQDALNRFSSYMKHVSFGNKKQLAFLEDLYVLINDGIPANRAIEMMSQVTTGITKEVAVTLGNKISEGQPLAEGMKEWFSPNVVEIIRVGEAGGALAQTIKSAINMLSQQGVAMGAFAGAIAYPMIVIIMGCAIVLYLKGGVFEQFKQIKPISQWPDAGKQLLALADFIQSYWWTVIVFIILLVIALKWLFNNYIGDIRPFLDKYPPFSFYRKMAAARLLETLGLLVSNGVVFKSALKVMQYQANPYVGSHLSQMEALLAKGKSNIADVLDTGLVEHSDLMRLRVMAEVKGFEHGLVRMGVRGTEEATKTLKVISKVVGGILLSLGGVIIIMLIRGIFMTGMAMGQ
jgi:type II secretory pathway component PulF